MNKIAYIIIGGAEAGKSTTIRALTGANPRKPNNNFDIKDKKGEELTLYVKLSSLQELYYDLIDPSELIKRLSGYDYCLIAVRVTGMNGCPDAETYVKKLIEKGWKVKIVYFDYNASPMPEYFDKFTLNKERINIHYVDDKSYPKANEIAATVRDFFEWI